MDFCTFRNQSIVFLIVLVLCLLLDFATSNTLSFIELSHTTDMVRVIHFEDFISILTVVSIALGILALRFASRQFFWRILLAAIALSTLSLAFNVMGVMRTLFEHRVNPEYLLVASVFVYLANVLIFTVWYWYLDYPGRQDLVAGKPAKLILVFPQNVDTYPGYDSWIPSFIDYLFLAFHTSSTVGPTDVYLLSHKAKICMICQVTISLIVLVALAARAIGILQ